MRHRYLLIVMGVLYLAAALESADPPGLNETDHRSTLTEYSISIYVPDVNSINLILNFRLIGNGSIGDYVWKDVNLNGIQNENETGISNVTVDLYNESGNLMATKITNETGYYLFSGLFAGNYSVGINETKLSPHWTPTISNEGDNDSVDSDGLLDGSPVFVNLSDDDANNLTIDFGFIGNGSIGDYVWKDFNLNGIQDENRTDNKTGISNATVELYDAIGNLIATNFTNETGYYLFSGLFAGNYSIDVNESTLPSGLNPTDPDVGNNDSIDSDGPLDGGPVFANLSGDDVNNQTIDFGYIGNGSIGDYVWKDFNLNGIQDENGTGISDVTVDLYNESGNLIATNLTNETGYYLFSGLFAGNYSVGINETELSPHWNPTIPNQGSNDSKDSDGPLDGSPVFVNLSDDDANNQTIDFGFIGNGSIGDYVWNDTRRDSEDGIIRLENQIQDENDTGIPNVTLILYDSYGNQINTTTNSTGYYLFKGLFAGNYTVKVDLSTVQRGSYQWDSSEIGKGAPEIDSNDPNGTSVVLPDDNTSNPTIDFGYYGLG